MISQVRSHADTFSDRFERGGIVKLKALSGFFCFTPERGVETFDGCTCLEISRKVASCLYSTVLFSESVF